MVLWAKRSGMTPPVLVVGADGVEDLPLADVEQIGFGRGLLARRGHRGHDGGGRQQQRVRKRLTWRVLVGDFQSASFHGRPPRRHRTGHNRF
jgi:hypothetical protein